MKTEAELWKDIKRKTASEVHWTRIEARVGAGVPDINGAFQRSSNGRQMGIEIWCELKVCKTKRYKTAGLWRPAQIAWQTARSKYCETLWNLVSHPQAGVVKIYNAQKIAGLWDDETGNLEPDQVLEYGTTWSAFLDLAAARAFGE
jgi:hypothetical protein